MRSTKMRLVVTVVAWSVCLLFTSVSCAKTAEPIEMAFGRGLVEGDQRTIGGDPDHPMEWVLLGFLESIKRATSSTVHTAALLLVNLMTSKASWVDRSSAAWLSSFA